MFNIVQRGYVDTSDHEQVQAIRRDCRQMLDADEKFRAELQAEAIFISSYDRLDCSSDQSSLVVVFDLKLAQKYATENPQYQEHPVLYYRPASSRLDWHICDPAWLKPVAKRVFELFEIFGCKPTLEYFKRPGAEGFQMIIHR